jgi:hypothetical protein
MLKNVSGNEVHGGTEKNQIWKYLLFFSSTTFIIPSAFKRAEYHDIRNNTFSPFYFYEE